MKEGSQRRKKVKEGSQKESNREGRKEVKEKSQERKGESK